MGAARAREDVKQRPWLVPARRQCPSPCPSSRPALTTQTVSSYRPPHVFLGTRSPLAENSGFRLTTCQARKLGIQGSECDRLSFSGDAGYRLWSHDTGRAGVPGTVRWGEDRVEQQGSPEADEISCFCTHVLEKCGLAFLMGGINKECSVILSRVFFHLWFKLA